MPVISDELPVIVLNSDIEILLRMDEELFFPFFVLEPDLIETLSSDGAVRLDRALCLFVGEKGGGHIIRIVNPACDKGLVRIAFEEIDNDLLADSRGKDGAILS